MMTPMTATKNEIAAILRTDLNAFLQKSFAHLNPGARLDRNWHHERVAYELERVFRGENNRLIVNAPLKSLIGSVAYPAFVLGRRPTSKFICASYSQDLAHKHASDFRRIVQSDWYRHLFQTAAPQKETEAEYQTSQGGFRLATSVGGTLTGRGGDFLIIDDALSAAEALSKTSRERVNDWYSGTLLSRLDDKRVGAIIAIMQRLHQQDLTGFLLEQGGWEHVKLPAVAQDDIRVPLSDLRTHEWKAGEPLDLVRVPLFVLDRLRKQLGADFFTAQYMQDPVPPGGNMLKREWLREFDFTPAPQSGDQVVQSWDTGMKATDTSDYSVCLTFLVCNKNQYFLIDVYRARLEFPDLAKLVCAHAQRFQAAAILIEDKVSGTSLIQTVKRNGLQGVIPVKPSGDTHARTDPEARGG